jgi:hypothetical protein
MKAHGPFSKAATSKAAIQNRIALLDHERAIPRAEIDQVLEKANTKTGSGTDTLLAFAMKYDLCLNWLIMGNPRGHPKLSSIKQKMGGQ